MQTEHYEGRILVWIFGLFIAIRTKLRDDLDIENGVRWWEWIWIEVHHEDPHA